MIESLAALTPEERLRRLRALAIAALEQWDLDIRSVEPLKVRENAVFAVRLRNGRRVALRVHRHGYHTDAALESEYMWLQALGESGVEVPAFVPTRLGHTFALASTPDVPIPHQVDVLRWIDGDMLGALGEHIHGSGIDVQRVYGVVGELAAAMHNQASAWSRPPGFVRHAWDREGLVGERPLWGRFWELEALDRREADTLRELRARVQHDLRNFGTGADRFGLIHADLVPENILVSGTTPRIIDFDDFGYGWHMFELATTLYFIRREPFYEIARDALIAGYRRQRPLPDEHVSLLPLFLAVRGTTYLGWVHTRHGEQVARDLTPQLIELALASASDYLN